MGSPPRRRPQLLPSPHRGEGGAALVNASALTRGWMRGASPSHRGRHFTRVILGLACTGIRCRKSGHPSRRPPLSPKAPISIPKSLSSLLNRAACRDSYIRNSFANLLPMRDRGGMGIQIFWLIMAAIVALIALNKGRSGIGWFLYGFLIWPIALVHILLAIRIAQGDRRLAERQGRRPCLHCAEMIKREAAICPFCCRTSFCAHRRRSEKLVQLRRAHGHN